MYMHIPGPSFEVLDCSTVWPCAALRANAGIEGNEGARGLFSFLLSEAVGEVAVRGDAGDIMSSTSGGCEGDCAVALGTISSRETLLDPKFERVRCIGKTWRRGAGDGALRDSNNEGASGLGHWKSYRDRIGVYRQADVHATMNVD